MTIKLNWWFGVGLFTVLFSVFALMGWIARDQTYEPIIIDRMVASPPEIRTQIVTQNVTEYVERVVVKKEYSTYPVPDSLINLDQIMVILATGKYNHLYYVAYPEKQNAYTGNTTFNREWAKNYDYAEDFIKAQQNEIVRLVKEVEYWKPVISPPSTPPVSPPKP